MGRLARFQRRVHVGRHEGDIRSHQDLAAFKLSGIPGGQTGERARARSWSCPAAMAITLVRPRGTLVLAREVFDPRPPPCHLLRMARL